MGDHGMTLTSRTMGDHRMTLTSKHRIKLKLATLTLMVLNALLVVPLLIIALKLNAERRLRMKGDLNCSPKVEKDTTMMKADYRRYCFRSSERECSDRGYDLKVQNNETVCCGSTNDHVYSIMSEEISRRLRSDASREVVLSMVKKYMAVAQRDPLADTQRPAAHVGILHNGNLTGPDSEVPRIHWEKFGERSFISGGVIHGGDRLTVTKPGYYYVYTGLQFEVEPDTSSNGPLVAYLYKHKNGTSENKQKLMTSRESSCRMTRGNVTAPVSMYTAGIYLLRHGDEISVRASSQSLLYRSSATTYMGLHMV